MGKQIDIYVHHEVANAIEGGQTGGNMATPQTATESQAKATKTAKNGGIAKTLGVYLGKQAFQYATSNYGDLTGDYLGQAWISEGIEVVGMIGMARTGVMGAVAVGVSLAKKSIDYSINLRKANQEAQQLRARIGGIYSSGGRR